MATEDHPFQTPKGWVRLGQLRKGDLVCVMPIADIESSQDEEEETFSKKVLFDETPAETSFTPKERRVWRSRG